jgi:hypothetical protein
MNDLEQLAAELRKKRQEQEERERADYLARFYSAANKGPTRPEAPLR